MDATAHRRLVRPIFLLEIPQLRPHPHSNNIKNVILGAAVFQAERRIPRKLSPNETLRLPSAAVIESFAGQNHNGMPDRIDIGSRHGLFSNRGRISPRAVLLPNRSDSDRVLLRLVCRNGSIPSNARGRKCSSRHLPIICSNRIQKKSMVRSRRPHRARHVRLRPSLLHR